MQRRLGDALRSSAAIDTILGIDFEEDDDFPDRIRDAFGCEYADFAMFAATEGHRISPEAWAVGLWLLSCGRYDDYRPVVAAVVAAIGVRPLTAAGLSRRCWTDAEAKRPSLVRSRLMRIAYSLPAPASKLACRLALSLALRLHVVSTSAGENPWTTPHTLRAGDAELHVCISHLVDQASGCAGLPPRARAQALYMRAEALHREYYHRPDDYEEYVTQVIPRLAAAVATDPGYCPSGIRLITLLGRSNLQIATAPSGHTVSIWKVLLDLTRLNSCPPRFRPSLRALGPLRVRMRLTLFMNYLPAQTVAGLSQTADEYVRSLNDADDSSYKFTSPRTSPRQLDFPGGNWSALRWTPWRHRTVDGRTPVNVLFATLLCGLGRLEAQGAAPQMHGTVLEFALEDHWTFADSIDIARRA